MAIEDRPTGEHTELRTHYLFAMIGGEPRTVWLDGAMLSDNNWAALGRGPYLLETSLPGVFAGGDVRANSVKRVAAAVGEGSMAVRFARQYLGQVGTLYYNFSAAPANAARFYRDDAYARLRHLPAEVDPGGLIVANHPSPRRRRTAQECEHRDKQPPGPGRHLRLA